MRPPAASMLDPIARIEHVAPRLTAQSGGFTNLHSRCGLVSRAGPWKGRERRHMGG